jgi:ABC-2 type transport system permease protein
MSLTRIKAILSQELFITKRSLEVIMDLPVFSIISIVVFGFISLFLAGTVESEIAYYPLVGIILWEVVRIAQYSMSVGSLWNVWSRNLSNMFITPISTAEYLIAYMISGTIKALVAFLLASVIAKLVFDLDILSLGLFNLSVFFLNLIIFAYSAGIIILGLIFRFGTRISALAWGLIWLFQPLTAVFFPVKLLPPFLQQIAYLLPPTYIFESARGVLSGQPLNWNYLGVAFVENVLLFGLSLWLFSLMFRKSKETGQFVRNEG